jgi:hypothetical protein
MRWLRSAQACARPGCLFSGHTRVVSIRDAFDAWGGQAYGRDEGAVPPGVFNGPATGSSTRRPLRLAPGLRIPEGLAVMRRRVSKA